MDERGNFTQPAQYIRVGRRAASPRSNRANQKHHVWLQIARQPNQIGMWYGVVVCDMHLMSQTFKRPPKHLAVVGASVEGNGPHLRSPSRRVDNGGATIGTARLLHVFNAVTGAP